ncbi:MAG TPA: T9SS type A sorting domain-containing protein [Candidatus Kapabacteria bacterium]|nr:T9SS type A sorting domain-containing protein [Candidatus Kapabacteria bacterium]
MTTATGRRAAWARLLGAASLIAAFACTGAHAQRYEYVYGGSCDEEGHGGVQQVSEGGYVAAGVTHSLNGGCGSTDIYVVRTKADGTLAWARTYTLGHDNIAYDIQEVKTPAGATDGFVLTGTTWDPNPCGGVNQDLLVLRIDRCGNPIWARSIDDGFGGYEIGYDIVVASNTDYIIAGTASGGADGFLVRINATGALQWAKKYDGTRHGRDYFYAVDEASNGDIIAAGGTNSTPSGTYDAWIVRTSSTGTFIAAPHNAVAYGGTTSDEDLRSIQKITQGTKAGDIIGVGKSDFAHPGNPEVLLVETGGDPCTHQVASEYGDNGNNPDEGYCVREIKPFTGTGASKVIVTGYLTPPMTLTHGLQDVFLKEFTTGTLAQVPAPGGRIYGSAQVDVGWSVSQTTALTGCTTDGFIVAGWGHGTMADPKQLYMIKTNTTLSDNCNDVAYDATSTSPSFSPECRLPIVTDVGASCAPDIRTSCPTWASQICYTADGTVACSIPDCAACGATKPNMGPGMANEIVDVDETTILPYPSPVAPGGNLTVEYAAPADGTVEIVVSDMNGNVVHRRSSSESAGINHATIGTEGWATGAYMIRVTTGGRSCSRGVMVLGR